MIEILIVEDEKPISDLIRLNLMKAGYSCTCAFDGMEAADILEERNFDLIILDVMLMCGKVTHKNLIDSSPLFRYCLTHASCNFFVKTIDSDTSKEI